MMKIFHDKNKRAIKPQNDVKESKYILLSEISQSKMLHEIKL